jgi:chloride channel protein, CIC family
MSNQFRNFIDQLLKKLTRNFEILIFLCKKILSERNFIYFSCVLVGISSALAVIVLKSFAHEVFVFSKYINEYLKFPFFNIISPIIGILLTIFVIRRILNGKFEKGSSRILYAVAKKGGFLPRRQMYAQIITSSLTVGLGGSAGLESPIAITGAAFGSNFAQKYRLSQKSRILLLGCGVAAGIAAAFNAPIAGVLFAVEVILTDVSISAFIPIIIAAATGALVSKIILPQNVIISFQGLQTFNYINTPYYILLGVMAGFVSIYHSRNIRRMETFFSKLRFGMYKKGIVGATLLALLIFFFPTLFGEGYESIKTLSNPNPEILLENTIYANFKYKQWVLLAFVGIVALLKSYATGLTLGSGGNGGNFAPSLFVGSYLGFFVAKSCNLIGITKHLPVTNFTIVGMAGILSGLFHAPLTAIFLIGEITGGYNLMVPLMIVSSISYAVSKQFEKHSMDVKHLADKGDALTSDKDQNILNNIEVGDLINNASETLRPNESLERLTQFISSTNQLTFAVLDENQSIVGIVYFNDVKKLIFNSFKTKYTTVNEVMRTPIYIVMQKDSIENIMKKFDESGKSELVVVKSEKVIGTLDSKSVLEAYRSKLKSMIID